MFFYQHTILYNNTERWINLIYSMKEPTPQIDEDYNPMINDNYKN